MTLGAAVEINSIARMRTLIKSTRLSSELTQAELARKAGVSRKWIGEFERGDVVGELRPLIATLDALGIKVTATPPQELNKTNHENDPIDKFIEHVTGAGDSW